MWWVGPSEQEPRDKGSRVKNVLKRGAWTGTASSRTIGQVHALGVRDSAVRDGVGIGGTQDTVYGWAGEGLGGGSFGGAGGYDMEEQEQGVGYSTGCRGREVMTWRSRVVVETPSG